MLARRRNEGQTGPDRGPGIVGVGIDVVELDRMGQVLDRWGNRFVDRVFVERERIAMASPKAAAHYAARFAAKEAFLKALGTGLAAGLSWNEVEIAREASGEPRLRLRGRAADALAERGVTRTHLSLSHSRDAAIAIVVLERTT